MAQQNSKIARTSSQSQSQSTVGAYPGASRLTNIGAAPRLRPPPLPARAAAVEQHSAPLSTQATHTHTHLASQLLAPSARSLIEDAANDHRLMLGTGS